MTLDELKLYTVRVKDGSGCLFQPILNENNYTYESVLENEKVKIKDKAELYVTNQLAETKFQNIITKNEDEKIKKCDCEAEIQNTNLVEGLFVVYSAQNTEDGNLKIVLDYIIPH